MRKYKVTIDDWLAVIEAETSFRARTIGVQAFRGAFPSKLTHKFLCSIAKVELTGEARHFKVPTINLEGVSEEDKQSFTGFWEGDGGISLNTNGYPMLSLYQKDSRILEYFRTLLGLSENLYWSEAGGWELKIARRAHVDPLLSIIKERVVSPWRIEQINRVLGTSDIAEHEPTWPWLAGFIDAEGHFGLCSGSFHLNIGQKNASVLYKIQRFVGFGSICISSSQIYWGGEKAWGITNQVYKFLKNPEKREQVYALSILFRRRQTEE